jgi:hypothetical protein
MGAYTAHSSKLPVRLTICFIPTTLKEKGQVLTSPTLYTVC